MAKGNWLSEELDPSCKEQYKYCIRAYSGGHEWGEWDYDYAQNTRWRRCNNCNTVRTFDIPAYIADSKKHETVRAPIVTKFNKQHFAELFRADYSTVAVTFNQDGVGGRRYTYKINKDTPVEVGDLLVVMPEPNLVLKVVTVREVHKNPEIETDQSFDYKWVVGKLSVVLGDYTANVEKDKRLRSGVDKLEKAMSRVALQSQLKLAMQMLPPEEMAELAQMFGPDNMKVLEDTTKDAKVE